MVPFYHQRRLPVAKINPSLTMLGDEEGVIIRQIRTFQMDQRNGYIAIVTLCRPL